MSDGDNHALDAVREILEEKSVEWLTEEWTTLFGEDAVSRLAALATLEEEKLDREGLIDDLIESHDLTDLALLVGLISEEDLHGYFSALYEHTR